MEAYTWLTGLSESQYFSQLSLARETRSASILPTFSIFHQAKLRYDASAMEQLFDLFDARDGSVSIAKGNWIYTRGLKGTGGDVLTLKNRIAIQLDTLGNGVIEQPGGCFPYTPSNGKTYMICW